MTNTWRRTLETIKLKGRLSPTPQPQGLKAAVVAVFPLNYKNNRLNGRKIKKDHLITLAHQKDGTDTTGKAFLGAKMMVVVEGEVILDENVTFTHKVEPDPTVGWSSIR